MSVRRATFVAIALGLATVDLLTKTAVFRAIPDRGADIDVFRWLAIGRTTNPGVAFGCFAGSATVFLFVSILAVPLVAILFWRMKEPSWLVTVALALIVAGTIGNGYDRAMFGEVRDFIKLHWGGRVFPLFNVADSAISVGVVLLSVHLFFFSDAKKESATIPAK